MQGSGLVIKADPVPGYYIGSVSNGVSPADRRSFITERRRAAVHRFDTLHSPHYDENWGAISASHAAFVTRLTTLIRPGGHVLDAACGTGKYWPALLAAGLRVTGVDQSASMLAQARRKHPEAPPGSSRCRSSREPGICGAGSMACCAWTHWRTSRRRTGPARPPAWPPR